MRSLRRAFSYLSVLSTTHAILYIWRYFKCKLIHNIINNFILKIFNIINNYLIYIILYYIKNILKLENMHRRVIFHSNVILRLRAFLHSNTIILYSLFFILYSLFFK